MKTLIRAIVVAVALLCSTSVEAAAPTLVSYTETSWTTRNTTLSSASVSWQAGDIIVVLAASEGPVTLGVPTATGLTFASVVTNNAAGTCTTRISTATAAGTSSSAVTVTNNIASQDYGFGVWVVRGSTGVGNSIEQHTTALFKAMTPVAANGLIIYGTFDFAAAALQTIIPTPSNTRQRVQGVHYTYYVADLLDQTSAGSVNYGLSGAGSGPFSIVAIEIKNDGGGGVTPGCKNGLLLLGVGCEDTP